jgi:hypothetical protein
MVSTSLPGNGGGKDDDVAQSAKIRHERVGTGGSQVLSDFKTVYQIKPSFQAEWLRKIAPLKSIGGDEELVECYLATIHAQDFAASPGVGTRPGSRAATDIDNTAGGKQSQDEGNDLLGRGSRVFLQGFIIPG